VAEIGDREQAGAEWRRSSSALVVRVTDAVSQWLYEPTLINGEPVEVEMTVIISFTLQYSHTRPPRGRATPVWGDTCSRPNSH
jgi:hypothetical protein